MYREFVTVLLLVIFASWQIFVFGTVNGKNLDSKMEGNLAEDNDNRLDDRETRMEGTRSRDFYADELNSDDDLFFSQDEDEHEKSVDYRDWDTINRFKFNDKTEAEKEEEKEEEEVEKEEEKEAEKGFLRRMFEKFKNWVHKLGK